MDSGLRELISSYTKTADMLFSMLAAYLGIGIPISNFDWALLRTDQRGQTPDGIKYFKHGYGVHMFDGKNDIDLDLGSEGEINGFDAWRLALFAERNVGRSEYSDHRLLDKLLAKEQKAGRIVKRGHLYYLADGA